MLSTHNVLRNYQIKYWNDKCSFDVWCKTVVLGWRVIQLFFKAQSCLSLDWFWWNWILACNIFDLFLLWFFYKTMLVYMQMTYFLLKFDNEVVLLIRIYILTFCIYRTLWWLPTLSNLSQSLRSGVSPEAQSCDSFVEFKLSPDLICTKMKSKTWVFWPWGGLVWSQ